MEPSAESDFPSTAGRARLECSSRLHPKSREERKGGREGEKWRGRSGQALRPPTDQARVSRLLQRLNSWGAGIKHAEARRPSMHRPPGHHAGVQFDFPEGAFVSGHVVLQNPQQRFGLLWAQIDALEVLNFHLGFTLLQQRSKDQEEIPDIDPNLHAVGVALSIVAGIAQFDVGLIWVGHRDASVAGFAAGEKALERGPAPFFSKMRGEADFYALFLR